MFDVQAMRAYGMDGSMYMDETGQVSFCTMRIHARKHEHMHAHLYARTHASTHARTHARTNGSAHACVYAHMQRCANLSPKCWGSITHVHTLIYTHVHTLWQYADLSPDMLGLDLGDDMDYNQLNEQMNPNVFFSYACMHACTHAITH